MAVQIRRAEPEDLALLMEWRMEVLREVFPAPQYRFPEGLAGANRDYYRRELPTGGHIACFARLGEEIIGCGGICLYSEMPSPDNPSGGCAYLMNIYTRPTHRGKGVGEAVVRWLIAQAKARGITKIYLETSEAGRRLYEKLGFAEMENMLLLPVKKTVKKN